MFARHTAECNTDLVFLSCIFNLKQLVHLLSHISLIMTSGCAAGANMCTDETERIMNAQVSIDSEID